MPQAHLATLALKKSGLSLDQRDVTESDEAFAAQTIAAARVLELDMRRVNPNSGAIAHGASDRLLQWPLWLGCDVRA